MSAIRTLIIKALSLIAFTIMCSTALAGELTAGDYVAMDLQAREATLKGVRDRLFLLDLEGNLDLQLEQDKDVQEAIKSIYAHWGTTPAEAVAWASRHTEAIQQYLKEHPEFQNRYDQIARELEEVSTQIQLQTQRLQGE